MESGGPADRPASGGHSQGFGKKPKAKKPKAKKPKKGSSDDASGRKDDGSSDDDSDDGSKDGKSGREVSSGLYLYRCASQASAHRAHAVGEVDLP